MFHGRFRPGHAGGRPRGRTGARPARVPAPLGRARSADLGLSPADLSSVRAKVAAGCQVLGLRYDRDPAVGTRFETLRRELGDNFFEEKLKDDRRTDV